MEENEDSRDVNENKLICLDRYLKLGDITRYPVEKGNKQQTGTVINVRVIVDLQSTYNENNEITILKDIDTIKLVNYYDIEEGKYYIYIYIYICFFFFFFFLLKIDINLLIIFL